MTQIHPPCNAANLPVISVETVETTLRRKSTSADTVYVESEMSFYKSGKRYLHRKMKVRKNTVIWVN